MLGLQIGSVYRNLISPTNTDMFLSTKLGPRWRLIMISAEFPLKHFLDLKEIWLHFSFPTIVISNDEFSFCQKQNITRWFITKNRGLILCIYLNQNFKNLTNLHNILPYYRSFQFQTQLMLCCIFDKLGPVQVLNRIQLEMLENELK